jgi:hypothetical protein
MEDAKENSEDKSSFSSWLDPQEPVGPGPKRCALAALKSDSPTGELNRLQMPVLPEASCAYTSIT